MKMASTQRAYFVLCTTCLLVNIFFRLSRMQDLRKNSITSATPPQRSEARLTVNSSTNVQETPTMLGNKTNLKTARGTTKKLNHIHIDIDTKSTPAVQEMHIKLNTTHVREHSSTSTEMHTTVNSTSTLADADSEQLPYYKSVVLLGQFNYNLQANLVLEWVEKWKQVFAHIQVRGPFDESNLAQMRILGIDAHWGDDDMGYYSPYVNMANTLRQYHNHSIRHGSDDNIIGVLQVHDDMLLNLTHLQHLGFPSSDTILTQAPPTMMQRPTLYFATDHSHHRKFWYRPWIPSNTWPNRSWRWWDECMTPFGQAVTNDTRASKYVMVQANDTVVPFWANAVGDFSYVPLKYAHTFADMAEWLADNRVFLECATPTIHGFLKDFHQARLAFVQYCTDFTTDRHNYPKWVLDRCVMKEPGVQPGARQSYFPQPDESFAPYGIFHPVKLSRFGPEVWGQYFDRLIGINGMDPFQPVDAKIMEMINLTLSS